MPTLKISLAIKIIEYPNYFSEWRNLFIFFDIFPRNTKETGYALNDDLVYLVAKYWKERNNHHADHLFYLHKIGTFLCMWYTEEEQLEVLHTFINYRACQSAKKRA